MPALHGLSKLFAQLSPLFFNLVASFFFMFAASLELTPAVERQCPRFPLLLHLGAFFPSPSVFNRSASFFFCGDSKWSEV